MVSNIKNREHGLKGKTIQPTFLLLGRSSRLLQNLGTDVSNFMHHIPGDKIFIVTAVNLKLSKYLFKHHAWPS
jgi:hypothetical protein